MMCGSVPQMATAFDPAQHLEGPGLGTRHVLDREAFGLVHHQRPHQVTATGSIIEPVAPRIRRGRATNRNSRAPAAASSSRSRLSMM